MATIHGMLARTDAARTADSIATCQLPNGMIPWTEGGHADPWNHVEAAMALATAGRRPEAEAAYEWLARMQRTDGSWHQYYTADGVEQHKFDANVIAYIATGVWHHYLSFGDAGFLVSMWPVVRSAVRFVLDLQTPRGEILWARHADGTPWPFALLTGSSSISHSLRCALAIARESGQEQPDWELALARLVHTIRTHIGVGDPHTGNPPRGPHTEYERISDSPPSADRNPANEALTPNPVNHNRCSEALTRNPVNEAFTPKDRFAMDWYYPTLTGVLTGHEARARLAARYDAFVLPGEGVRCVSDREWVTTAETCECAMAFLAAGDRSEALKLFGWAQRLRRSDGRYLTGVTLPDRVSFPDDERTTYSAAAVLLAADAFNPGSATASLFAEQASLPTALRINPTSHQAHN